jgi:hypothetical protein
MLIIYRYLYNYEVELGFWTFFIPIILVFFVIAISTISLKILTKKNYNGWKFWLKYFLLLVVGMELCAYAEEAYIRKNNINETCKKEISPDFIYVGEVCVLSYRTDSATNHVWLRVYDYKETNLIKEGYGGFALTTLYWMSDKSGRTTAMYADTVDEKATLTLPPSWLDKLRAKLP